MSINLSTSQSGCHVSVLNIHDALARTHIVRTWLTCKQTVLPPSEKCSHGYPIANIRLVDAFTTTKRVSALLPASPVDKDSFSYY